MSWKRWHWLNDAVLPLTLITLRLCWLWLWLGLARRLVMPAYSGPLLPAWLIGGLLLASLVATGWLSRRSGTGALPRLVLAGLGLATMFLVFWGQFYRQEYAWWEWRWLHQWGREMLFWVGAPPPSYLALPVIVYAWLRGIVDGSRPLRRSDVVGAFGAGCVALALFLVAAELSPRDGPPGAGNVIFLFFATAMMALALSSLQLARVYEPGRNGQPELNRYWLGSALTVILGLLAVGLLLSLLISPAMVAEILALGWSVVSQTLLLLIRLTGLILFPVLLLVSLLEPLLARLAPLYLEPLPEPEPQDIGAPGTPFDSLARLVERMPDEWRWVGLVIFFLAIGLLFVLVWRRVAAAGKDEVEETRELIFSRDLLQKQLAQWWPDWLRPLRRQSRPALNPFLSLDGETPGRRAIREVYQALLAAARQQGWARARHQTPAAYGRGLAQVAPGGHEEALRIITDHYAQARYGQEPPSPEQGQETRQAWERLQKVWLRD